MTRRLTIARDGTVKLRGKATRWTCRRWWLCLWYVYRVSGSIDGAPCVEYYSRLDTARAALNAITDEELMG